MSTWAFKGKNFFWNTYRSVQIYTIPTMPTIALLIMLYYVRRCNSNYISAYGAAMLKSPEENSGNYACLAIYWYSHNYSSLLTFKNFTLNLKDEKSLISKFTN